MAVGRGYTQGHGDSFYQEKQDSLLKISSFLFRTQAVKYCCAPESKPTRSFDGDKPHSKHCGANTTVGGIGSLKYFWAL